MINQFKNLKLNTAFRKEAEQLKKRMAEVYSRYTEAYEKYMKNPSTQLAQQIAFLFSLYMKMMKEMKKKYCVDEGGDECNGSGSDNDTA